MPESAKIEPKALGKAWGIFWAGFVVFLGISSRFGWGKRWETLLEDLYPGYNQDLTGICIGGLVAFIDGFFDAYIIGKLYNRFTQV